MYFSIGNTSCRFKAVFESEVAIVNGFPTVHLSPIAYCTRDGGLLGSERRTLAPEAPPGLAADADAGPLSLA